MSDTILKGIRVVETARYVAAPMCARILASFGAEVIKVETGTPGLLDQQRTDADKTLNGYRWPDSGALKKSASLSLKHPEAIKLMKKLLLVSDVFVENFLPDGPSNLGLDYEELRKGNPGLIIIRMPGLGLTGPYRNFVAYGMAVQALGGVYDTTGFPGEPIGPNYSYPDYISGTHAALSVLAALDYRRRTGKGQIIEAPLYMAMSSVLGSAPLEYSANKVSIKGMGNADRYMFPHNAYKCEGEDRWCVIAVSSDTEWTSLCKVLGNPAWAKKPEYDTVLGRKNNIAEIDKNIGEWTAVRSAEDVIAAMQKAGVPCGIVAKGSDFMSDPHLKERGYIQWTHNHPRYGSHPNYSVPPGIFSETPTIFGPAPGLGADNDYVFGKILGVSPAEMQKLADEGVFK
ncbi:MAG: CaiB/BaiF CoA transferase family protein [Smithellaceae bacterium]